MNVTEYTYLLNKPDAVNDSQVLALEKILEDFPYFQSVRSLHLKGLYKQDSFKYNQALKCVAAYTTDRTVLFDFITSENFTGIQKNLFEEKEAQLLDINVIDSTVISEVKAEENTLEKSIISSINEAAQNEEEKIIITEEEPSAIEEKLEIGKPLAFNHSETHSFQEWLQLAKVKPIEREENTSESKTEEQNLASKLETIDKFIEANPKIPQIKGDATTPNFTIKAEDTSYLMTETLAKVYLEQKKYNKAIQAYEILILKYPEKITFFADRISDIKFLKQNNN
ncbi:tetratricopeptide repeat protein [Flavobacterium sp.]|uniref:tetratricopeptide repeat protein n=1 Tax=Flavobacterium sp. TaxID=239 RepID=UPI00260A5663|nr:tetratricopeptide repeat protein [Flavobacterium sp.]